MAFGSVGDEVAVQLKKILVHLATSGLARIQVEPWIFIVLRASAIKEIFDLNKCK